MGELTDKAKGKAKQVEGVLTGDKTRQAEGMVDELKGGIKGAIGKVEHAGKAVAKKVKGAFRSAKP